jgi:hypothetical protein
MKITVQTAAEGAVERALDRLARLAVASMTGDGTRTMAAGGRRA